VQGSAAPVRFTAPRVSGAVRPLGAMLADCRFDLGGGRLVDPFAAAPWAGEAGLPDDLPGILAGLSGEWPCVPFGMPSPPPALPADWTVDRAPVVDPEPHGHGANSDWTLMAEKAGGVLAAIGYPAPHPVRWLERTVRADERAAAIDVSLTVHVRRDTVLPIGVHPTFRLPDDPRGAGLVLAGDDVRAWTFPIDAEPGASRFAPDRRAVSPRAVPNRDGGGTSDLSALDLTGASEDLVLLTGLPGRIALDNRAEGWRATLTWDAAVLPSCLIWISNGGRRFAPWNGRFRAIGIEPVAAPFDLGVGLARAGGGPLGAAGIATAVAFRAGHPFTTGYRIEVEALA